jgi:hypothetical protein
MYLSFIRFGTAARPVRLLTLLGGILLCSGMEPDVALGQAVDPIRVKQEVFVGSELETYLRLLQIVEKVSAYPWTVRGFGPGEVARLAPTDTTHPWADRYDFSADTVGGLGLGWVRPQVQIIYNSAVPYGSNDGAVWAGRGITAAARVGVAARFGGFSLVFAPEMFRAQNQEFEILRVRTGEQRFADPMFPTTIDLPQRFGDGSYSRVTFGQSALRLDVKGFALGASTANQQWGPAWSQPLVLGNNAEGFPHAFAGTQHPVNVWIGRLHGRVVWGMLGQSGYSSVGGRGDRRLMTGMVATFEPHGMPGLEVGGSRFFHAAWPEGGPGLDDLLWPFQSLLKARLDVGDRGEGSNDDNQLASVFARWVLAGSAAEIYGEYAREDHSWNLRDLALEPDHDSGYVLGLSKAWALMPDRIVMVRGEVLNTQVTHLDRVRPQAPFYRHTRMRQGHTHLGQILGASSGYGGSHSLLAADLYHPAGRWGAAVVRSSRLIPVPPGSSVSALGESADVMYSAEIGGSFFLGRFEIDASLAPGYEFNRNLEDDVFNLNARLQARIGL